MKTYQQAAHAMQSGVAMMMNYDNTETEPKHLRVGLNSAFVNDAALAQLLIDKGIITLQEYQDSLTKEMNKEVERYEHRISEETSDGKTKIKLN